MGRAEIAISARGLAGRRIAQPSEEVRAVNLDIVRGQLTVIAGTQGSGKSALLWLLAGLERPRAGSVWIGERRIHAGKSRPAVRFRRDEVAFVPAGEAGAVGAREVLQALAPEPAYAFLDEPVSGAGAGDLDLVRGALYALTAIRCGTAVVATAREEVAVWADRLLVVDRGALVLDLEAPTPAETLGALTAVSNGPA